MLQARTAGFREDKNGNCHIICWDLFGKELWRVPVKKPEPIVFSNKIACADSYEEIQVISDPEPLS